MRETAAPVTQNNASLQVLLEHIHLLHFPFKHVHFFSTSQDDIMSLFCNVTHAWPNLLSGLTKCKNTSSFRNTFLQRQQQKCQQKIYKKRERNLYMFTALQTFPLFCSEGGREPLTVVWVEEVSVDVSREGFLYSFHLFLFFLLLLFKHGSWRPIKTHNQKQLVVFFVLKRSNPLHFCLSLKSDRNMK